MHRKAMPWSAKVSARLTAKSSIAPRTNAGSAFVLAGVALLSLAPELANAKITMGLIQGASNYVKLAATDANPAQNTIYGGLAGLDTAGNCATAGATSTCNNCVDPNAGTSYPDGTHARFIPCNQARIRNNSVLTINFSSDTGAGYPIMLPVSTGGTGVSRIGNAGTFVQKGGAATLSIDWRSICNSASSNGTQNFTTTGDCSVLEGQVGVATIQVQVGISANGNDFTGTGATGTANDQSETITITIGSVGTAASVAPTVDSGFQSCDTATVGSNGGVCAYYLTPGDAKANVKEVLAASLFPLQFTGLAFRSVRFFYVDGGSVGNSVDTTTSASPFGRINTGTTSFYDLSVASDGLTKSLTTSRIMGLSNERRYYVKSAMVDMAGNVAYFQPDASDGVCSPNYPLGGTSNECHTATPSEVLGLLEKDLNCFIATASYGSVMAPQVETFRRFRDRFLQPSAWGRAFVRAYYKHSPRYARMIAGSESLRFASRAALAPLLGYAWLSLKIGATNAALLLAALCALPYAGFRLAAKRRARLSFLSKLKDWKRP